MNNKVMRKMLPIVIISILLGSILTASAVPILPMTVIGDVYVDDVLAGAGLSVYAKSGATVLDTATTDADGYYVLSVSEASGLSDGDPVDLWVETTNCDTVTMEYGNIPLVADLYITGGAPPEEDTGILYVNTVPFGGAVYLDDVFWGLAPVEQEVDVGFYTVSFGEAAGFTTPDDVLAEVTADEITSIEVAYVPITGETGTLNVITTPVNGPVFVDGDLWGVAPQERGLTIGEYTVSFGAVADYDTPVDQVVEVEADLTTEVEGLYVLTPDDEEEPDVPDPTSDFSIDYISDTTVDYDDTLTVIGSGVTAGTTVNIYWDYASGTNALLLNTTEGKPKGTFEVEIDVPSDYVGEHWLWAEDVSTGETIRSDAITMVPRIKLSPSSGLAEDEVTIKGYGFTDEANFTSLTFGAYAITETPGDIETDEDGFFEYTFDVPEDATYDDYAVRAEDFYGESASKTFTLGASITLDPEEGPTGTKVKVEGRGFTKDATISFAIDGTITVHVVEDDVVTVEKDGTFSAEIVIPGMDSAAEYEITATESGNAKGPGKEDFEVDGIQKLKVSPTYGTPGATITVTGANFTQIAGTEVTVMIGAQILVTAETESDGTFEDTFISPAIEFTTYDVIATDEDYDIVADDAFKVGLIVLIINPSSGEAGTKLSLTGIGFAEGEYNVTFTSSDGTLTELSEEHGTISSAEALSDPFYVPNFEPGTYYLTVSDTDENELTVHFMVTAISKVVFDPAVAPNDYNVSIEGYNFADVDDGAVEFIIYNSTHEWDMEVWQNGAGNDAAVTDDDGNFTAWWEVLPDEDLSIGDYTVNVTGSEGLLVQVPFSVVEARVSVAPRKAEFDRGDRIQFDINNDFKLRDSYIMIYDPYDTLYWETEPFENDWWLQVEGLYTVPYYRQTAAGNPMEIQSDAPMGAWLYIFYDSDEDQLMNGTFSVGPSAAAQVDALLEDVRSDLAGLAYDVAGITDDIEDDIGDLAEDIANAIESIESIKDDIVSDLEGQISDAAQAGWEAQDAVDDLADAMSDLGDAVGDIADTSNDAADAAQSAADAANDAVTAAEDAGKAAQGLTGLVYGAIGASLIAALAAIVSLMQISKKIAG